MIVNNLTHPVKTISIEKASLGGPLGAVKPSKNNSKALLDTSIKHFENIFRYIRVQQKSGRASLTSVVPDMDSGFQASGGRWGDLQLPHFDFSSQIKHDS